MDLFGAIRREYIFISSVVRTLMMTRRVSPGARITIADWLERFARSQPDAPALLYGDRIVTWKEFNEGANAYANWARREGLTKGEVVGLLMNNRPEYLMAWIGLNKNGCIAALINTNLTGLPLSHSIAISNARHMIVEADLAANYEGAAAGVEKKPVVWGVCGKVEGVKNLDAALKINRSLPAPPRDNLFCRDKALYIYTSGTTGMPKAAQLSHMRVLHIMMAFQGAVNATPADRMYDVLPLYHSAGGICAVGPVLLSGASLVIRHKFSATEFWDDCYKYKPTLFQYIGELCRYLLNTPAHPLERKHSLRIAIGNGLRPEIWPKFQERFQIPHIMEFYGATEGNVGMIQYDGKVGAIGRVPWYARQVQKIRLVRYDIEKQMPVRSAKGLCIETRNGEIGEAIGAINQKVARERFDGYTKKEDTEKKILHDVFKKGDTWFRTGDLMRRDEHGYFYFVDRTGDTFRWKGENVSTSEVAEAISSFAAVREANVYGVEVPGGEGKAGMVSLVADPNIDLAAFAEHLKSNLPTYARPVFLRFQKEIEATSTFKQRKVDLQKEGFDPATISDPLYVRDEEGAYVPLTPDVYRAIQQGKMKL